MSGPEARSLSTSTGPSTSHLSTDMSKAQERLDDANRRTAELEADLPRV